jgi:hypothetical protein
MSAPKPYNGHRSWNAWNVALWIGSDEGLYNFAMDCIARGKGSITRATKLFLQDVGVTHTPDGARYNALSVSLALKGLEE